MLLKTLFSSFLILCTMRVQSATYKWEDLEVLVKQKSHVEFFKHAKDISPSKRGAEWKAAVESMGKSYFKELTSKSKIMHKDHKDLIDKVSTWSIFKTNEFFISERDNLFIHQIETCLKFFPGKCRKLAFDYYKNYQHAENFSFHFLKSTQKIETSPKGKWEIIALFIQDKYSEFYCNKAPLKAMIINKISTSPNSQLIPIHRDCANKIKKELFELSKKGNKHALNILNKHTLIEPEQKSILVLIGFLNRRKHTKRSVDITLRVLNKLEQAPEARKKIVDELSKLDPLPGEIFKHDNKISLSKTKMLERHIPEYLDMYAKTCLAYLKGSKVFPKGNPTPECHGFFKIAPHIKTLPKSFINSYRKVTHFKAS